METQASNDRFELRFSGSGGQGLITAAVIFAEAVGVHDGRYVCQTQSYGPEARGGKSKAEIVVSDTPIDYPKSLDLDLLLAMNQEACDAYYFDIKAQGLLIVDSTLVEQYPSSRVIALPFTQIARDEIGREMVANMVALGAVGQLSKRVDLDSLEKALLTRVPKGTEKINIQALQRGIDDAAKVDIDSLPRSILFDDEEV